MTENGVEIMPAVVQRVDRAEIDVQIETAKRYPRDLKSFKRRATEMATMDQETAESCFYVLKRTDKYGQIKYIEGPSVRLAEIVVSTWGNIRAACRFVGDDGKSVTCQATCHDLESNVAICVEVQRSVTGKNKKRFSQDVVTLTVNSANSVALRNAVFKAVPMAFVKEIYAMARAVAVGDTKTLDQRRTKCLETFAKIGVTAQQVCEFAEVASVDAIGLDELAKLIGLFTAIKNGDTTVEEAFPKPDLTPPAARPKQPGPQPEAPQDQPASSTEPPAGQSTDGLFPGGEGVDEDKAAEIAAILAHPMVKKPSEERRQLADRYQLKGWTPDWLAELGLPDLLNLKSELPSGGKEVSA